MADYISPVQKAYEDGYRDGYLDAKKDYENPSVDVAERKHGKWSETYNGDHAPFLFTYTCSVCKGESFNESNYYPNCGAQMEKS